MMSGNRSHEQIEELIAIDALDGLDEAGSQELIRLRREHGPNCLDCLRLESEYRGVAGQLATTVEPMPLSREAEASLMQAIRAPTGEPAPRPDRRDPGPIPGERRIDRRVAAVAIAAAIALLGGLIGYSLAPRSAPPVAVSYRAGGQQLTVVYVRGQTQGLAIGSNLPPPGEGKVYELWYQPSAGAKMVPAGTFEPRNGTVVAPLQLGESFVAVAMSVEPRGGSPQPTTTPVFVIPV